MANKTNMENFVQQQKSFENDIERLSSTIGEITNKIHNIDNDIEILDKELNVIKPKSSKAQFINKCLFYNKWISNKLENFLKVKETEQMEKLESEINNVYSKTFKSTKKICLQNEYSLRLFDGDLDITNMCATSGAESTMLAFAFIGGVIESSKTAIASKTKAISDIECVIEPYPLVLDAPSSNFDKSVIRNFCETVPKFAEQLIILIKDADGEYVKNHLNSKIGKDYEFIKKNDWLTEIEEV